MSHVLRRLAKILYCVLWISLLHLIYFSAALFSPTGMPLFFKIFLDFPRVRSESDESYAQL